jgi:hypothetical protein
MTDTPPSPPTPRAEANAPPRPMPSGLRAGTNPRAPPWRWGRFCSTGRRIRRPVSGFRSRWSIGTASSPGRPAPARQKTLQVLTEQLSAAGVPVVVADIKGDLSGLAQAGTANDRIAARAVDTGDDWAPTAYPVELPGPRRRGFRARRYGPP